ncbi:MAG TPA: DUF1616 domain-containing protein, partial [Anaerolineae bacterium]|nr:DUF1616 domain-containing protein [Anaerolineae bacterium]
MPKNSLIFHLLRPQIWPLLLLIGANILIIAPISPILRYTAALMLLAFLPGWVWLHPFFDPQRDNNPSQTSPLLDIPERFTLAIGLSLALTI